MKDQPVPHQPTTENPYVINEFGYVSQESAGFYEKFMSKYCNVKPEGYYLGPPSTNEMKVLKDKKKKAKHAGNKRKRVKSKATISDDEDDGPGKRSDGNNTFKVVLCSDGGDKPNVPRIKILLPVRRPQQDNKTQEDLSDNHKNSDNQHKIKLGKVDSAHSCKGNASKAEFANQPKRQYVPPPLSFEELLKLAEKKQHEPILISRDSEFDFKRPMTRKEKALYKEKMERSKRRKEKLNHEKPSKDPASK